MVEAKAQKKFWDEVEQKEKIPPQDDEQKINQHFEGVTDLLEKEIRQAKDIIEILQDIRIFNRFKYDPVLQKFMLCHIVFDSLKRSMKFKSLADMQKWSKHIPGEVKI